MFDCDQPACLWLRRALGQYAKTRHFSSTPAGLDAATLCRIVEALGLEGFLYQAENALPYWRKKATQTLLANLRALHATAALFRLLEAARIPAAAMRGVVLAHRDYASPAERPMRDVDILCPADARPEIVRILAEAGHEHAAVLRSQDVFRIEGVTFELHWALLTSKRYRGCIDEREWLNNRQPLDTPEGRIFTLAPEHEFFGLILHACVHHELTIFKQLLDIALFLAQDELDWPRIAEQAGERRLGRMFALALGLTDALFLLDAPACRHFPLPAAMRKRLPALVRPFFGQDGIREYAARKAAMLFAAETPERRFRQILGMVSAHEARDLCRHVRRRK